jgi:uncharacterized protein (TIGR02145 family)
VKRRFQISYLLVNVLLILILFNNCKKENNLPELEIKKQEVKHITINSAICYFNLTIVSKNSDIIDNGICWSISKNPTINNNIISCDYQTSFNVSIYNLSKNTKYYVRAYATNTYGTSYGSEISFTTLVSIPSNNYTTVKDIDSNSYKTLIIGSQTWMAENLRTTKYNDGTLIPNIGEFQREVQCTYKKTIDTNLINVHGRLYSWYVINTNKLCPRGWHVPTDNEWTILKTYLITNGYNYDSSKTDNKLAKSMANDFGWQTPLNNIEGLVGFEQEKNNSSGFSGMPSGYCNYFSEFDKFDEIGYWWSQTELDTSTAYFRRLSSESNNLGRATFSKYYCLSVRCLKD